ncbi:MAG: shikimate dehydrogenase [Ruminococcaceae bacterium]|nr:shikimate dehydrogenase [Oscillospiraceae bacterium]
MFLSLEEFRNFTPTKPTYAVFGSPILHSLSPTLQTLLAEKRGTEIDYLKIEVTKETLPLAISLAKEKLCGFNCTHPLKEEIIKYLDCFDTKTRILNACNTVCVEDGKFFGHNTDGYGIKTALSMGGVAMEGARALLLGCGGAASAFAYEASCAETHLTIAARNTEKAKAFANRFPNLQYDIVSLDNVTGSFDFVVNSTPVGMVSNPNETPIDLSSVNVSFVYDMIYEPAMTKLLRDAEMQKIPFDNGLSMLVSQGAESQRYWFGLEYSLEDQSEIIAHITAQKIKQQLDDRNVVLSGFMCAGKSTLGSGLAKILGREFIDTDTVLASEFGCSISEFFAKYGEAEFRMREAELISRLSEKKNRVISLGGGAILNPKSAESLRENGIVLFLNPPFETLSKRFAGDSSRPLLQQDGREKLYHERLPIYRKTAHKTVTTQTLSELLKILQGV